MVSLGLDTPTSRPPRAPARRHRTDAIEYRVIFSICFAVLLGVGVAERLLPRDWRFVSTDQGPASLLSEVTAAAHRTTAIAFQG